MSAITLGAALACGILLGENKISQAVIVASVYIIYAAQNYKEYQCLQKTVLGSDRPVVDKMVYDPDVSSVIGSDGAAAAAPAAVPPLTESEIEDALTISPEDSVPPPDQLEASMTFDAQEGPRPTGLSRTLYNRKFSALPHERFVPAISASIEDNSPGYSMQNMDETKSKDSFYSALASGGDIEPRRAPGTQTMNYFSATAPIQS